MSAFSALARKLYDNGFSIIPVRGKRAFLPDWGRYGTERVDEATLDSWIVQYGDCNIGFPAGPINGCFLDNDSFTEDYGNELLRRLPPCEMKRFGSKGFVLPVKYAGEPSTKFKFKNTVFLEFMSTGSQVVAFGTHPEGMPYHWFGPYDLTEMTIEDFRDVSIELPLSRLAEIASELERLPIRLHERDALRVAKGKASPSGAGGRNNKLKEVCGAMFERGVPLEQVAAEILSVDRREHSPPLFSDKTEFPDMSSPENAAMKFAVSIFTTFLRSKSNKGETVPQLLSEDQAPAPELACNKEGVPYANMDNVSRILSSIPKLKGALFYDHFYERILTIQDGHKREWTDADDLRLLHYIQAKCRIPRMTLPAVQSGVEWFAHANAINGPLDWLKGLKWDGCKRIDEFFRLALGSDDTEYVRAASGNFWKAMAARISIPGCKFDNMVVLEGHQGAFKSSALEAIGGEWYGVASDEIGDIRFLQSLAGKLVVEIAELDSFGRAAVTTIKSVLSTRVDTYRPPYGRRSRDFKRRCVLVGTTNEDEYLEDTTGGRRFWPVVVTKVDLEFIRVNREQLFAEAFKEVQAGAHWWEMPDDETKAIQESRRRMDPWEDILAHWLDLHDAVEGFTTLRLASEALHMGVAQIDKRIEMRISRCMKVLGFVNRQCRLAGNKGRYWFRAHDAPLHGQTWDAWDASRQEKASDYNSVPTVPTVPTKKR